MGGYRDRREKTLRDLALGVAKKVLDTGRPYHFDPMSAMERRVVHMAITEREGLRTESEGSRKSAEHFGELLKATAAMDGVQQLEGVLAEQFDVDALSTVDLDKRKDLEGRFRYWLSRQRG